MTDETRNKLMLLSDLQIRSLFWFIFGWFVDNKGFETACKSWLKDHGAAR